MPDRSRARLGVSLPQPRTVTRWLVVVVAVLLLASIAGQILRLRYGYTYGAGLVPLFYVDDEANVPTWYSSSTLLVAAILLLLIAVETRSRGEDRGEWRYWGALATIFAALSLDEVAQVHELLIAPLRGLLDATGYLYYPWVLVGALCSLAAAIVFARFLLRLPAPTRTLFVVAGLLYLGGALGVEMISARLDFAYGSDDVAYVAAATVEEALEMVAIVVFLHALVAYLHRLATPSAAASRSAGAGT